MKINNIDETLNINHGPSGIEYSVKDEFSDFYMEALDKIQNLAKKASETYYIVEDETLALTDHGVLQVKEDLTFRFFETIRGHRVESVSDLRNIIDMGINASADHLEYIEEESIQEGFWSNYLEPYEPNQTAPTAKPRF